MRLSNKILIMATDTQTQSALQCMKILVSYKICTASSVIEKWIIAIYDTKIRDNRPVSRHLHLFILSFILRGRLDNFPNQLIEPETVVCLYHSYGTRYSRPVVIATHFPIAYGTLSRRVFATLFLGYLPLIFGGIRHLKEISKVCKT